MSPLKASAKVCYGPGFQGGSGLGTLLQMPRADAMWSRGQAELLALQQGRAALGQGQLLSDLH